LCILNNMHTAYFTHALILLTFFRLDLKFLLFVLAIFWQARYSIMGFDVALATLRSFTPHFYVISWCKK